MAAAKNPLLSKLSQMLPTIPLGGPLPRKEIIKALRRLQKYCDHLIKVLERSGGAATKAPKPRAAKRKPARK